MTTPQRKMQCPFCGTYTARAYHVEARDDHFVKCDTCNNSLPPTDKMVHSEAEAIAAWMGAWAFKRIAELTAECERSQATTAAHQPSEGG